MILVTGATGLVGGHLLWHLLQENAKVVAIKRNSSNLSSLQTIFRFYNDDFDKYKDNIEWRIADVLDEAGLVNAFDNVDVVYHCAAVVSLASAGEVMIDTNVRGTKNIVDVSLKNKVAKLCFVSSIAACGHVKDTDFVTEKDRWFDGDKRSAYSRSKFYSEAEIWKGIERGLNAVIVNPGVILGVSGTHTGSAQLFLQVKKGLMFYTNGGSSYIDVKDVVKCMIMLVKADVSAERFILSAGNYSNKEILSWIADGFSKARPSILVPKSVLLSLGFLLEILSNIFRFKPVLDIAMARTASNRTYYSNQKIIDTIGYEFNPIHLCIQEVCEFGI